MQGKTICRYWTKLNAGPKPSTVIQELVKPCADPQASVLYTRSTREMVVITKEYFNGLQDDGSLADMNHNATIDEALQHVSVKLNVDEKEALKSELSEGEIEDAVQEAAWGKAPGLDGLPAKVWKTFLEMDVANAKNQRPQVGIVKCLTWIFQDIANHGVADSSGFADGWVCPIYKLKKDVRNIKNYRPITLLNVNYKIMTQVIAMRLADVAPRLIHRDQARFVPGRSIFDHIYLSKMALAYGEAEELNRAIVALGQEKAYDKINHHYLWKVMHHMNVLEGLITTIQNLYKNAKSLVIINSEKSDFFTIVRGMRQGDPMSCLLFNLAIELLACALQASQLTGMEIPGLAEQLITTLFADDTTVYLHKTDNYENLTDILATWCKASRAHFNAEKTKCIPVGTEEFRKGMYQQNSTSALGLSIPGTVRIIPDRTAVRSLGAWLRNGIDISELWNKILDVIATNLERWAQRKLTMYG